MSKTSTFDDIFASTPGPSSLINADLRLNFVKKVYSILSAQLALTFGLVFLSIYSNKFHQFQNNNPFLMIFFSFVTIVSSLVLICAKSLMRKVPHNYIFLGVFTFSMGYVVSSMTGFIEPRIVLMAIFLTFGITLALTLYSMTTKRDITYFHSIIFMFASILLFLSILRIFVSFTLLDMTYTGLGAIMGGIYIVYDTKMIIGGGRGEIGIDDYIFGAILIYMDVVNLFIKILKILQKLNEEEKNKKKNKN